MIEIYVLIVMSGDNIECVFADEEHARAESMLRSLAASNYDRPHYILKALLGVPGTRMVYSMEPDEDDA